MSREDRLNQLALWVFVGFIAAVIFHYAGSHYFHQEYPLNTYLFKPSEGLSDLLGLIKFNQNLRPYQELYHDYFTASYPPFAYLSMLPFTALGWQMARWFYPLIFTIGCYFFWKIALTDRKTRYFPATLPLLIVVLATHPFQFALDRLNAENLLFLFLCGFFLLWRSGRTCLGAVSLGAAAAMKIYPGIFVLLLLRERRWKAIAIFGLTTACLTLLSLLVFHTSPSAILETLRKGQPHYSHWITGTSETVQDSLSLYSLIRLSLYGIARGVSKDPDFARKLLNTYYYWTIPAGLLAAGLAWLADFEDWERVLLLVATILLLPPVSFFYKALHLFFPVAFFLSRKDADPAERSKDWWTLAIFAILLIPKSYFKFDDGIRSDVLVNTTLLFGIWVYLTGKGLFSLKREYLAPKRRGPVKTRSSFSQRPTAV